MSSRIPLPHAGPARRTPFVPWPKFFAAFVRGFQLGEHVTVVGPTGAGKSTLLAEIAEAMPVAFFVNTKRRDSLVSDLIRKRGWRVVHTAAELRGALLHVEDARGREVLLPAFRKVVVWPAPGRTIPATRASMRREVAGTLDLVFARGGCAVVLDEVLHVSRQLGLSSELSEMWHQARSGQTSVISASQRPAWVPREAFSSATHLFFFRTADPADAKRLRDIGAGIDPRSLERDLQLLERFEFLYLAPREQPPIVLRSWVER